MATKPDHATTSPQFMAMPWLDPSWMTHMNPFDDEIGVRLSDTSRDAIDQFEILIEGQLVFARSRARADFEYAKALSRTRDPLDASRIVAAFWQQMFADYTECADKGGATLRDIAGQACSTGLEIAEKTTRAAGRTEKTVMKADTPDAA